MRKTWRIKFLFLGLLLTVPIKFSLADDAATANESIRRFDFKKYFLDQEEYRACPMSAKEICASRNDTDFCPDGLSLSVKYLDVTGDRIDDAIINGSSCNTGTAGPDIHHVFSLKGDTRVELLTVAEADKKYFLNLFGNNNFTLDAENGQLVAKYSDTSGRQEPLIIKYKWVDGTFKIDSIKTSETFKTSYDCAQADEEHDRAICHVKQLADLDLELAELYRRKLEKLSASSKQSFAHEQEKWLSKRNSNCTMYKWWVDCLRDMYKERIATLKGSGPV